MGWPNPSYTRWLGTSTRPVVEDGLSLTVHRMARLAGSRPGTSHAGAWQWSRDGERTSTVDYWINVETVDSAELILTFRLNGDPVQQRIWLERRPCRFGGGRWFAQCPATGETASKLYLPPGGRRFLSRHAYKVAYRSQRECEIGRASLRRFRLATRLGLGDPNIPIKPPGMRWATFDRALEELDRYDTIWSVAIARRFGIRAWE